MLHVRSKSVCFVLMCAILVTAVTCRPRNSKTGIKAAGTNQNASLFTPGNRNITWEGRDRFLGDVQPVLASRCVACHGCTDSPCSAKMGSHELIQRGASGANPYGPHVFEGTFIDGQRSGVAGNYPPGFYPTISKNFNDSLMYQFVKLGFKNTTDRDPGGGFDTAALDSMRLQYLTQRNYECPENTKAFQKYATKHPMAGMPFGLPRLEENESKDLLSWIAETGGQGPSNQSQLELVSPTKADVVIAWDRFLNQSPGLPVRSTLMARYLYEHWFNAHIAFDEMPGEFFRIVRTTDAPGPTWSDPTEIITELPTDDPNVGGKQVFYRFKKITEVMVAKSHTVFELSKDNIRRYEELFLSKEKTWRVTSLPKYTSADPFANFKEIPEEIRHIFMLEHSRYIVDSMVRAPVCVGTTATYAIADHFWVYFLKPGSDPSSGASVKMSQEGFDGLNLDVKVLTFTNHVNERFTRNYNYLMAYEDALRADLRKRGKTSLTLDDLWYGEPLRAGGEDHSKNAWLSITRHDVSTTVQYGLKGGTPQSSWILSYANFERLYYNLVVNFKYWGAAAHKLGTWRSMSHERMDGEDLFLSLLPVNAQNKEGITRNKVRMNWSGGLQLGSDLWSLGSIIAPLIKLKSGIDILEQRTDGAPNTPITRYIDLYPMQSLRGSPRQGLQLAGSESPEIILERMIRDRMVQASVVSAKNDPLNAREDGETIYEPTSRSGLNLRLPNVSDFASFEKALGTLGADRGKGTYAAWLPATVLARVQSADGDARVYSFIGNRAYVSHDIELNSSSKETSSARLPANDTISIYHGVIGDRPDLFLDIPLETKQGKHGPIGANEFFQSIAKITNENHREALKVIKDEYGVLRNSSKFWPFYDWMHRWMVSHDNIFGPGVVYAGVLDLMQYDPPYELNHQ